MLKLSQKTNKIDLKKNKGVPMLNNRQSKFFYIFLILIYIVIVLLLPKSIWGFYQVQAISNIYIDNFDIDTLFGSDVKPIFAYLVFLRFFSLITNSDPLLYVNVGSICCIIGIFLLYYKNLIALPIKPERNIAFWISIFFSVFLILSSQSLWMGYIYGYSLFPALVIVYFILIFFILNAKPEKTFIPFLIITIISWIALGYYWHTYHFLMFFFVLVVLSLLFLYSKKTKENLQYDRMILTTLFLFSVTFVTIFLSLRENILSYSVTKYQLNMDYSSLFVKGSFTGPYTYHSFWVNNDFSKIIDISRYFNYALVALILAVLFFYLIRKNSIIEPKIIRFHIFLYSLFISEIIFMFFYYFSTKTTAARFIPLFLFPILVLMLFKHIEDSQNIFEKIIKFSIICLIIFSIVGAIFISTGSYLSEYPETNIPASNYKGAINWLTTYKTEQLNILSDSHTSGHFMLYIAQNFKEKRSFFQGLESITDVSQTIYSGIQNGNYILADQQFLIVNNKLYSQHLVYESLINWNKYEPISRMRIDSKSSYEKVYTDGMICVYN